MPLPSFSPAGKLIFMKQTANSKAAVSQSFGVRAREDTFSTSPCCAFTRQYAERSLEAIVSLKTHLKGGYLTLLFHSSLLYLNFL